MRRIRAIALISATLLAAGCGAEGETLDLDGTTWTAAAVDGEPVDHSEITAIFNDGTMAGSAGCNRYNGSYATSGSEIAFPHAFVSTLMACEEQVMMQERNYLQALEKVTSYEITGGSLRFFSDGDEVISFTEVSQDLAGTAWSILSYLDGNGRVSVLPDTATSIEFDGSRVSGSAGCNSMSGAYKTEGSSLSVEQLAATEMFCVEPEGVMEQEHAVAKALESAAEYRIEGRTLTIWDGNGTVLLELERP